jgi:transposase InsO family protein
MDFIEGLPKSDGKDVILVVVDPLTKYAHFIPLSHPFTAITVARVFLENIYKLHGVPTRRVSDRDKIFTSKFWRELCKRLGITLLFSIAYHPQTDDQSKWVNKCLENFLRCMCFNNLRKWAKWLALTEL